MLRRLFDILLIGWFASVAIGVPLPSLQGDKPPSDERFPCENCPCGCKTAEHCWTNCCCHSLSERLAWAQREGVTPPAFVVAAAKEAAPRSCYQAMSSSQTSRSCCSQRTSCCAKKSATEATAKTACGKKLVVLKALQCQGISFASQSITLAPPPLRVQVSLEGNVESVVAANPQAVYVPSFEPLTPPPQGCLSRYSLA